MTTSDTTRKGTTKSGGQKHELDKFYTKPEVAKWCLDKLDLSFFSMIIEPSAGSGSFSNQIPGVVALDLDPEHPDVKKQDWFEYEQERDTTKRVLVVGNPPFGQQNTLAVEFINHAAKFADEIAFILPVSFMKESVQSKLNKHLTLSQWHPLPKNSFTLGDKDMNVPCVFQVWSYDATTTRAVPPMPVLLGFSFVKKVDGPDLYLQRVGGNAGSFGENWQARSEQSNYFIKVADGFSLKDLKADLSKLVYPQRDYGVGPRSVSKKELLTELVETGSSFVALP